MLRFIIFYFKKPLFTTAKTVNSSQLQTHLKHTMTDYTGQRSCHSLDTLMSNTNCRDLLNGT